MFMGSATTAVAAINTGRNFVGFELNNVYYDMCLKRIEKRELTLESDLFFKKNPSNHQIIYQNVVNGLI